MAVNHFKLPWKIPKSKSLWRTCKLLVLSGFIVGIITSALPSFSRLLLAAPGLVAVSGRAGQAINRPGSTIYLPVINNPYQDNFYYGVLENAGWVGNSVSFASAIKEWQSRYMNGALLINAVPDLSVSDRMNFKVVASPLGDLYRQWFFYEYYHNLSPLCGGSVTIDCARRIIGPMVDAIKNHPSIAGYYIFDDATPEYNERIRLANQVFQEHDAVHPASPGLLELGYGQKVYDYVRSQAFISYEYPVWNGSSVCDFTKGTYRDWVDRMRETMQAKPMSVPFWTILQGHGSPTHTLRTPTVEEVRLLNWQALGEDAKGIFWFTWSTDPDQFWIGIKDNPALLAEITDLSRRVSNLHKPLSQAVKISDKFQVLPAQTTYVSTLKNFETGKLYVIAANNKCTQQTLTLSSSFYHAKLKDLESGVIIDLDTPLALRGGDGKLFEVVEATALPIPTFQENLVKNASFESDLDDNNVPDQWGATASATRDTTNHHSGGASLKVTGPAATAIQQTVTLKPNTKYYVSWYMKSQNLVDSRLAVQYWQTSPSTAVFDDVQWEQSGSYDWVKRVGFFITPADYEDGKLTIAWNIKSASTYWVDDLSVCEAALPCADAYLVERETR